VTYGLKEACCLSVRASGALNAQLLQTARSVLKASGVIPAKHQRFTPAMIAVTKGSVMDASSEQKDAHVHAKRDATAASLEKASSVMNVRAYPLDAHPIVSTPIARSPSASYLIFEFKACCAKRLLSMQPDFQEQQCSLEEEILNASWDRAVNRSWHRVLYLPKYHPELNHIEFFWCQAKRYSRENCNYTFEGLRQTVPAALDSVMNSTILGNYHSCLRKMELYRAKITYGSGEWKALTSHKRVYMPGEDR
jgi:hypothetical protein